MQTANPVNVFITGAATALGREVTRRLKARGHQVTGVVDGSNNAARARQDGAIPAFITDPFRAGEWRSLLRAAQTAVVMHLTPQLANSFPRRDLAWDDLSRAITEGTPALLQAASEAGVKFFVYPSFAFVYGDHHGEWVDEESPRRPPALLRPIAKVEDAVLGGSVPAVVLRAGRVYGGFEDGTTALVEALRRGRPVYTGDANAVTSWVHIADLAEALALAAEQMPAGQVFNVADDEPVAPAEFIRYLANNLGLPEPGKPPALLLRNLTNTVVDTLLGTSARLRNNRAKQTLGWTPRYPTYRAGLDQTLLVWRAEAPVRG
ncbi:MAG: NAD(P)-dependent oxidoreductase [Chloroflexi bacterium]|nr:NAD(P)-dependent oxidoreductase [Chloroflexota bacterium]